MFGEAALYALKPAGEQRSGVLIIRLHCRVYRTVNER